MVGWELILLIWEGMAWNCDEEWDMMRCGGTDWDRKERVGMRWDGIGREGMMDDGMNRMH